MNITEILENEKIRRKEFPVAEEKVFLAHAAVSALPWRVADAMAKAALYGSRDDQEWIIRGDVIPSARRRAAKLIGARPEEIAFVGPTSVGLSMIAGGLPWQAGDNVIIYPDDYPSNVYPWTSLAEKGVEVRKICPRELGRIEPEDVLGLVDGRTRLVALASCHFLTGWRLDVEAIGRCLHERGIWFCVDAIQTLGAFPTTVQFVDFLAADAHKWLLGPCGAGLLYVRKELQEQLRPILYGWHNIRCPEFVAQEKLVFVPDARRYEAGSLNLLGFIGLNAAMELLLELGIENIAAELLLKRAWLVDALRARGWKIFHADAAAANASAILTIHRPGVNIPELHERLMKAGVVTSLRTARDGARYLRLSPHFYNTREELERLLQFL